LPPATHVLPSNAAEQSRHEPDVPHVLGVLPVWQTPFAEQHPDAHGFVEQPSPHLCVSRSQT
jgi:hypothetical protein